MNSYVDEQYSKYNYRKYIHEILLKQITNIIFVHNVPHIMLNKFINFKSHKEINEIISVVTVSLARKHYLKRNITKYGGQIINL